MQKIPDPLIERTKRHVLVDILVIAICAVICGAGSGGELPNSDVPTASGLAVFWFYRTGIASHDTRRAGVSAAPGGGDVVQFFQTQNSL